MLSIRFLDHTVARDVVRRREIDGCFSTYAKNHIGWFRFRTINGLGRLPQNLNSPTIAFNSLLILYNSSNQPKYPGSAQRAKYPVGIQEDRYRYYYIGTVRQSAKGGEDFLYR